jgi:hypothetical protein
MLLYKLICFFCTNTELCFFYACVIWCHHNFGGENLGVILINTKTPLVASNTQSKKDEIGGTYSTNESHEKCLYNFREPEEKRLLEKFRHGWENNIKMELKGIAYGDYVWLYLAEITN